MHQKLVLLDQKEGEFTWSAPHRVTYVVRWKALPIHEVVRDDPLRDQHFSRLL